VPSAPTSIVAPAGRGADRHVATTVAIATGSPWPYQRSRSSRTSRMGDHLNQLFEGKDTPNKRAELSISLANSTAELLLDDEAIQSVSSTTRNNVDLLARSKAYLREPMTRLVDIILMPVSSSSTVFSSSLKDWCSRTVGGWVYTLEPCFVDGLTSIEALVKRLLATKLSSVGEVSFMLPMVSGMISAVIISCYQGYRQERMAQDGWAQHVPVEERMVWLEVVAYDEEAQLVLQKKATNYIRNQSILFGGRAGLEFENPPIQHPLSNAYLSGQSNPSILAMNKRKFTPADSPTDNEGDDTKLSKSDSTESDSNSNNNIVSSGLHHGLVNAVELLKDRKHAQAMEKMISGLKNTKLNALYRNQIERDLRKKLRLDSDFSDQTTVERLPNIAKLLKQVQRKQRQQQS